MDLLYGTESIRGVEVLEHILPQTVVLALESEEIVWVQAAITRGDLHLALRNALEAPESRRRVPSRTRNRRSKDVGITILEGG